jgi:exonuclease SbcC
MTPSTFSLPIPTAPAPTRLTPAEKPSASTSPFALALSRLLTQRSGSDLQTLIIDEGFGSQDATGRAQLLAAINAIAPDFACILVITHIPSLQDAFPRRIEVQPSPQGSRLSIRG